MALFSNRQEAGTRLAQELHAYEGDTNTLVLALPRGGVPVASIVSTKLNLPLDIFLVRKLGTPGQEELAMGALGMDETLVLNPEIADRIPQDLIDNIIAHERETLRQRNLMYRQNRPYPNIENRTIILIDDGVATGATMRAAIKALKQKNPKKLIVAIPVCPPDTYQILRSEADEMICLATPEPFFAVGAWYDNFEQTSDEEVISLLEKNLRVQH